MSKPDPENLSPLEEQQIVQDVIDALERLQRTRPDCVLMLAWSQYMGLVSALQLALRHPQMPRRVGDTIRRLVEDAIAYVEGDEPRLAEIMRMGNSGEGVKCIDVEEAYATDIYERYSPEQRTKERNG